jgi:hypothetical protein
MMAIRLPESGGGGPLPQHSGGRVGIGQRSQAGGGWQAMPPILPPAGTSPNIPTAIVPPGVPPHGRPLAGAAGGGMSHPAGSSGYHPHHGASERIEAVHPRMMEQPGRQEVRVGGGGGVWSAAAESSSCYPGSGGGRGAGREYPPPVHHQPEGPAFSNGGRTGGSGRIISSNAGRNPSCVRTASLFIFRKNGCSEGSYRRWKAAVVKFIPYPSNKAKKTFISTLPTYTHVILVAIHIPYFLIVVCN